MADPNTRQGKRTPVTLKIKFKSETLEQFIERYAVDVSQGGIFIRTKEPLAVGTQMKFEFQLRDASPLIAGEGTVVWTRENDPSRPAIAPGMGVRFDKLAEGSQAVLEKILAEKQKQAPGRGGSEATTKPPMFTDTPTKVAPAPVQEALGVGSKRRREDSEQTPLPKPMPFHSDAEDFDERAFEEATKVRSLDELAAATAGEEGLAPPADDTKTATKLMPPDELAARRQQGRADSTLADPPLSEPPADALGAKAMPDRDSAPGLPPSPDGPRPRMLDNDKGEEFASRTLAGHEPAKAATSARMKADSSGARALATEPSAIPAAPKRPSSAPIIIGILLVVVGAIVAIYFLFLKQDTQPATPDKGTAAVTPDKGSAGSANVGTTTGSAGSATTAMGSNTGSAEQGSAATGSATTMAAGSAAAHPVDTIIAAGAKGATVAIEGTDMTGPAPFTAKLEKDKDYKAKVSAPGFVAQEIDVKGGQKEITAKLVAKPKQISVTSTPAGAEIAIDGALTGKQTPADITLTTAQAARAKFHVTLRHAGFRPLDQIVDASTFTEDDAKLTATINATLTIAPKVVPNPNNGTTTNNNNNAGSAATPTGTGSGSAATPTGTGTTGTGTTGTGTGSAATPTGTGTTGGSTSGGTTTPPAGGTTTPPAGGSTTTPPPPAPSGGTAGSSSGQVLK